MFQSEPQRGSNSLARSAVQASPPQRTFKRGIAGPARVQQHPQGGGRRLKNGRAGSLDQIDQRHGVPDGFAGGDDDACPANQRQEDLQHGDVESERGDREHRILGVKPGRRCIDASMLTTERCSISTPLGLPVEPEV